MESIAVASESLHAAVEAFVTAVSEEYIDFSGESKCEQAAAAAVERFKNACEDTLSHAETLPDKDKGLQLRQLVVEAGETTSVDIITYQRAVLRFKQRKIQFRKCNPLTRSFMSPRAQRYDTWAEDCASPRSRELGEVYCILLPFLVFGLFATGFLLSSLRVGGKTGSSRVPTRLASFHMKLPTPNVTMLTASLQSLIPSSELDPKASCSADLNNGGDLEL